MDYIFRYPLNKAHYYQRQAESKEINRQFSSAKKLRELSLESLNASLSLSSNDVIQSNIRLQIAFEKKQIERLEKLCTGDVVTEPITKNLNFTKTMAQVDDSFNWNSVVATSTVGKNPSYIKALICDIAKNTEQISLLVRGIEAKLDGVEKVDENPTPEISNPSTPRDLKANEIENTIHDGGSEEKAILNSTNIRPMLRQLNEFSSKTLLLSSKLMQEFTDLQSENNHLSQKFESLKLLSTPVAPEPKKGEPRRESYVSTPLSVEDFAPLDCPPMDFLNTKSRSPKF